MKGMLAQSDQSPESTFENPGAEPRPVLEKVPTGIEGLDQVTNGGLPAGRPTLVCGSAGSGKTLLAMEFLVRGARDAGEPGVFMAFEESEHDLAVNMASLGFDVRGLEERGLLAVDHVELDPSLIIETGQYDLEGLFIRLAYNVDRIGAKRVVIDTIEVLFGALHDSALLRSEFRRLLAWLKDRDLTVVITGERGDGKLTRHGIEEYVSDCVIVLDHRVHEQISTRRLRVVKYRGSLHGANEYPFLISSSGVSVLPVSSVSLNHQVSEELVSSGIPRLDTLLGGGVYRSSSVLVSGDSGTGKTTVAAYFADSACRRGERALYVSYEESMAQLLRNMRSVGLDLKRWVDRGLLRFCCARPASSGLEQHLSVLQREVNEFRPSVVAIDPISGMETISTARDATALWARLIDFMKSSGVTTYFTSLVPSGAEHTEQRISSLMDTWLMIKNLETNGERNRGMYVLKSRGMAHSNQIREFLITDHGVELLDVHLGTGGVLTGSARAAQEALERAAEAAQVAEAEHRREELQVEQEDIERQIAALRRKLDAGSHEIARLAAAEQERERLRQEQFETRARMRRSDTNAASSPRRGDVDAAPGSGRTG